MTIELRLLNTIAERASDFKLARRHEEFCSQMGGLDEVAKRLWSAVEDWESYLSERDDHD